MNLIRPGARKMLKRWAEPLIASVLALLGLWWAMSSFGLFRWLGFALCCLGCALIVLGIRRVRFWGGAQGVGHVEVDEGEINYFTPEGGGAFPVSALQRIDLVQGGDGRGLWRLSAPGLVPMAIPTDASGAEVLYDVFANLPGIDMQGLLRALNRPLERDVVIWQRKAAPLH
ncbi:hypothetical protein [Thalassovita sp.]|uniref:hypothetical protein n=1 Tax=Thalassovita sp. TaxID=1979401 RepID=UPI0029DE6A1A|nr:hypothetical protein [Thalassovita sp.]